MCGCIKLKCSYILTYQLIALDAIEMQKHRHTYVNVPHIDR